MRTYNPAFIFQAANYFFWRIHFLPICGIPKFTQCWEGCSRNGFLVEGIFMVMIYIAHLSVVSLGFYWGGLQKVFEDYSWDDEEGTRCVGNTMSKTFDFFYSIMVSLFSCLGMIKIHTCAIEMFHALQHYLGHYFQSTFPLWTRGEDWSMWFSPSTEVLSTIFGFFSTLCVCVFSGHQSVYHALIMRWWGSKLRQRLIRY